MPNRLGGGFGGGAKNGQAASRRPKPRLTVLKERSDTPSPGAGEDGRAARAPGRDCDFGHVPSEEASQNATAPPHIASLWTAARLTVPSGFACRLRRW
jgi:hypothetical protein